MKRADCYIVLFFIVVAAVLFICMRGDEGQYVRISSEGVDVGIYSLAADMDIPVVNSNGNTNIVSIRNGEVSIQEADCPNGICVNQEPIDKNGGTLCCVPNRLLVDICEGNEGEYDGITR